MPEVDLSIFSKRSVVIYLSYAPAGLGHLRVADALYRGLPEQVMPILLGENDYAVSFIHRFASVHTTTRNLMEWMQQGTPEKIFALFYIGYLNLSSSFVRRQLEASISQHIDRVETVVVVATHFGLAHQIGHFKKRIEKEKNVKIFLVVQVTDDSPQRLWYVPGADVIFSPSERTALMLAAYGEKMSGHKPDIAVIPYPVNPRFQTRLSNTDHKNRISQASQDAKSKIHVMIPLSGAAVGTDMYLKMMRALHKKNPRFFFHVVVRDAPFTIRFLQEIQRENYLALYTSKSDRDVVDAYENIYEKEVIGFEITKPSEQSFKALFEPAEKGGSILLFMLPVGRQEYDNLYFLSRHNLIPTNAERDALWRLAAENAKITDFIGKALFENAVNWRGVEIPQDPEQAVQFILWAYQIGLFERMSHYKRTKNLKIHAHELAPTGVAHFWAFIADLLKKNQQ